MTGNALSKSLLTIGNVIKNMVNDEDDLLKLEPDVLTDGKVTRIMSKFIITPNIIIDQDLKYIDQANLTNIIKTEVNLFTGIVTNALRVLAGVYHVRPKVLINALGGQDRADKFADFNRVKDIMNGIESFDYVADALFNKDGILPIAGVEATVSNQKLHKDANGFMNVYEIQIEIYVGKSGPRTITMPLIVYPNVAYTDANTLLSNMLDSDVDKGILDRIDQYRAGLVSLSDLIFATDLVKKYRDKKIKNPNDVATYLNAMDKTTTVKELLHNKKVFHKNYNIYILDVNKQATIEKQVKGSLFKNKYKDTFLNALAAFSACLVDDAQEEVVIYIDDIPGFSALSYKMLTKDKNNDITTIMKDLFNGKQPF